MKCRRHEFYYSELGRITGSAHDHGTVVKCDTCDEILFSITGAPPVTPEMVKYHVGYDMIPVGEKEDMS